MGGGIGHTNELSWDFLPWRAFPHLSYHGNDTSEKQWEDAN